MKPTWATNVPRGAWLATTFAMTKLSAWGGRTFHLRDGPLHHFVVVLGALYRGGHAMRSGQIVPDYLSLRRLHESYGLRTVDNLCGPAQHTAWYAEEQQFYHEDSLKPVDIPLAAPDRIRDNLREVLAVVTDPANQPAFVHCDVGIARTGLAVAAYRSMVQRPSCEAATNEARRFRFKPRAGSNPVFLAILRELSGGGTSRAVSRGTDAAWHRHLE